MEKPTRGNLFDDSDGEDEYKPEVQPEAVDKPVEENKVEVLDNVEEEKPKEEVQVEAKQEPVAQAQEEEEEYVPKADPEPVVAEAPAVEEAPVVEDAPAVEEQIVSAPEVKPAATTAPTPFVVAPHVETEAEKKLKAEAEQAKIQMMKDLENIKVGDQNVESAEEPAEEESELQKKFSVTNPQKSGGAIKYTVTGVDEDGDFSELRRFREFYALFQVLQQRWPGCYVPSIPEKKMVGKEDTKFIEERRVLLERFMKDIAKHEYIQKSQEFKVFSRGKGDVDKVLASLPKQSPMELLTKYRESFQIEEEQEGSVMDTYKDRIMVFQQFLKKTIGIMEMQKKQMKNMEQVRERQDKSTSEMMTHLMKFEDVGIEYYSDQVAEKRTLTHPSQTELKEKIEEGAKKLKNPYRESYIWLKGEFMDVNGMYEALQGRESLMKKQISTEQKKRSDKAEMDKLQVGKKTVKSIFKSKAGKESSILNLQTAIEQADKEVEDYKKVIHFLTIYHGQISIPAFKQTKAKMYLKSLNNFCVKEISNAHASAILYHSMLDIGNQKKEDG